VGRCRAGIILRHIHLFCKIVSWDASQAEWFLPSDDIGSALSTSLTFSGKPSGFRDIVGSGPRSAGPVRATETTIRGQALNSLLDIGRPCRLSLAETQMHPPLKCRQAAYRVELIDSQAFPGANAPGASGGVARTPLE